MKVLILSVLFLSFFILDQTLGQVTVANCPNNFCLVGNFELDANYYPTGSNVDWTSVITTVRRTATTTPVPLNKCNNTRPTGAAIYCDDIGTDRTFNDGKWNDPTTWKTQTFANYLSRGPTTKNFPPKDDIIDVLAYPFLDADSNSILMNAFSRFPGSGSTYFDFEYNKFVVGTNGYTAGNVLLNSSAANTEAFQLFSIPWRTNGDIVISYSIDQNGFEVDIYILNDTNCNNRTVQNLINSRTICQYRSAPDFIAIAQTGTSTVFFVNNGIYANDLFFGLNSNPIQSPPWGNGYDTLNTQASQLFAEVGLNIGAFLSNLGFSGCFNWLNVKSRASQSISSNMKDATGTLFFTFCVGINLVKFIDYNSNGIYDAGEDVTGTWRFSVVSTQGIQQYVVNTPTGVALTLSPGSVTVTEEQQNGFYSTQANFLNSTFPAPPRFNFSSTPSFTFNNNLATRTIIFGNNCFTQLSLQVTGNPATQQLRYNVTVLSAAVTSLVGTSYTGTLTGTNTVSVGSVALVGGDQLRVTLCNPSDATDCISFPVTVSRPAPSCSFLASVAYPTLILNTAFKYNDFNYDGTRNNGEGGLSGFVFTLRGPAIYTATSNADGTFSFPSTGSLLLGAYTLNETLNPNFQQTQPANNGFYNVVVSLSGVRVEGVLNGPAPFGNAQLFNLVIFKYKDLNANGVLDAGEPPVSDVLFTTTRTNPTGFTNDQRTGANGRISYTNLFNGAYTVTETVPSGSYATTPTSQSFNSVPGTTTTLNFGNLCFFTLTFNLFGVPSDGVSFRYVVASGASNGFTQTFAVSGGTSTIPPFTTAARLVAGNVINFFWVRGADIASAGSVTVSASNVASCSLTQDFGFPQRNLTVFKFDDKNGNSQFNPTGSPADVPLAGARFILQNIGAGSSPNPLTSGNNGLATFFNLNLGTYSLTEDISSLSGYTKSYPTTNGYIVTVSLANGVQITYSDNSVVSTTCNGLQACFGNQALTGVKIVKFIDLDANGAMVLPPDYFSNFTDFTFSVTGSADGFSRTVTTTNGNVTIPNINLNSVYTVTETQRSGFYNTTALTQTQTPASSAGIVFYFGNMCFVNLAFTVNGVPASQPSLDIVYFVGDPKVPANIRNFNANQNYTITLTRSGATFVGNSGSLTLVAGDVVYYFFRVGTTFGALQTLTVPTLLCTTGVINVPVNPPFPPICVNVFKYQDRDNSSSFNAGDSAQNGFQFAVSSSSVTYTSSGTTNAEGRVSFCNLPAPFTFTVTETQRVGWVNTFPQTPSRTSPNPSQTFSTTLDGAAVAQVNFGNVPRTQITCSFITSNNDFPTNTNGITCSDSTNRPVPLSSFVSGQLYPYQLPVTCIFTGN